jgi:flagellin-like hook-associated protein FlgL
MNVAEFTTSASSRIEDADFAAESARLGQGTSIAADRYSDAGASECSASVGFVSD